MKKKYTPIKSKGTAIILAILLSQWTWAYTAKYDGWKLALGLILVIFGWWLFFIPVIIVWIWAIVDTLHKPDEFFEDYYK